MSNKSYFTIDVIDYINEEEDVEEYGKRVYIDVTRLVDDIIFDLKKKSCIFLISFACY